MPPVWHRVLETLLLPPTAPLLLVIAGLLLQRRRRKAGTIVCWCGVLYAVLAILPAAVGLALNPLESAAPPMAAASAADAQAIVILGGGQRGFAPEYGVPTVNAVTLERLRYGARLARETGLPIMVCGGNASDRNPAEATLMAEALSVDFGVKPMWQETRSATTAENARYGAEMLRQAGITRIVLVTHAAHMRRALDYFRAQGLQVVPAPTSFLLTPAHDEESLFYPPSAGSAFAGWYAAHEWAGLLQRKLFE
ncbi:MAG: YdcF family protein [Rhodocyclaceae bacterium]|nr:YdcF family protein [Rhodocyclaceae bacterium]